MNQEYIKKFRSIMKNYMNLNYSKKFLNTGKYHIVLGSVTKHTAKGVFISSTGNSFTVCFDSKNKTTKHIGVYSKNRNASIDKIFYTQ